MFLSLLTELEAQAERTAEDFDPALLTGAQAARAVTALSHVEKIAAGLRTLAAGRVADTAAWKKESGAASSAHWLAHHTGTSIAEAVKDLQTSERLHRLPATQKALRHGELSTRQAHLVADAAAADPTAEGGLLELAGTASLKELESEAVRTRAAAEPDEMARYRAIRRSRFLRHRTGTDGAFAGTIRTTTDDAAVLLAAVADVRPAVFNRARRNGDRSPAEAYALDALIELCRRHLAPHAAPAEADDPGGAGESGGPPSQRTHDQGREPGNTAERSAACTGSTDGPADTSGKPVRLTVLERDAHGHLTKAAEGAGDTPLRVKHPFPLTIVPSRLRT